MRDSLFTRKVVEIHASQANRPTTVRPIGFVAGFRHHGDGDDGPLISGLRRNPLNWNDVAADIAASRYA